MASLADIPGSHIEIGSVECIEIKGSQSIDVGEAGTRGTRRFICDWADRIALATAILGGNTSGLIYDTPDKFPDFEIYANSVSIAGFGAIGGAPSAATYDLSEVTAHYSTGTSPNDTLEDVLVRGHEISTAMQAITLPLGSVKWGDGASNEDDRIETPITIFTPMIEHRITIPDLGYYPSVSHVAGTINSTSYATADIDHMMFLGANVNIRMLTSGSTRYEVVYLFRENPKAAWNEQWHPIDLEYKPIKPDIYESVDWASRESPYYIPMPYPV